MRILQLTPPPPASWDLRFSSGTQIWQRANSTDVVTGSSLNPFVVLTFADLKKYRYWYWCGFPALLQKPGWETEGEWQALDAALGPKEVRPLS